MKLSHFLCGSILAAASLTGVADGQSVDTLRIASGLSLPVYVTYAPGDPDRLFILEKRGRIRVFHIPDNELRSTYFLNTDSITGGGTSTSSEQGLLGMAFHPDYENNGEFYIYYTNNSGNVVVSRYTVSSDPEVANSSSASTVITVTEPYTNHNGGQILFGPDGYLWIFTGDGGGANDTQQYAQNINNLNGKILRLDVDSVANGYAIPPDNMFVGTSGRDEIWATGLRNPWRASFDRETGDLYIGDVGQNAREEVNIVHYTDDSLNYGWRCMEGTNCTGLSGCTCNSSSLTDPVYSYSQSSTYGYCITGGYVYRGCKMPDLHGTYFFADYSTTNMFSIKYNGAGGYSNFVHRNELETSQGGYSVNNISSFGEDYEGELYVMDQSGGELFKIIPAGGDGSPCVPAEVCDGDANGDDQVNGTDLSIILGFWGPCPSGCDADLNGDLVVDGTDLSIVLGYWGKDCG